MALSQTTLADALVNMVPCSDPDDGALAFAQAVADYMDDAVADSPSFPIIGAAVQAQVSAMAAAVSFSDDATSTEGATELKKAIDALWTAMVAAPATFFAGAIAITPPTYAGLVAAMADTMDDNTSIPRDLEDSADELASDIHSATDGQGTATWSGPIVRTIT